MKVAVIGAGSWGTALANVLAERQLDVTLWARRHETAQTMSRERRNPNYLRDVTLSGRIEITDDLHAACANTEILLLTIPTQGMREIARKIESALTANAIIVSTAKGFEPETNMTMSEVLTEILGPSRPICALSGPNIAHEIAHGMQAATVVAAQQASVAEHVRDICNGPQLRFYSSVDVRGVEFGGALKNIVAIAAGVCDGLELGDNAKAAIITRGLAEMARLGVACGGHALTFAGLTGLGDCVATCMSPYSRNRGLGEAIARGQTLDDVLSSSTMVVEGVGACRVAVALAARHGVEMPIAQEVNAVLFGGKSLADSLGDLMKRGPGDELAGLGYTPSATSGSSSVG